MSAPCVLDETWRAVDGDVYQGETCIFRGDVSDGDYADAPIAAAAPEMARLLLKAAAHETWCSEGCGKAVECAICYGSEGHAPDCALVAVLRKAGVIE